MKSVNKYGQPNSIKEINKYISDMGYDLQIWREWDLFGATIWFGHPTVFGREFHIDLNELGKYVAKSMARKDINEAELRAAQKAYWFVKKFLNKTEIIPVSKEMQKARNELNKVHKPSKKEQKKMLEASKLFTKIMGNTVAKPNPKARNILEEK